MKSNNNEVNRRNFIKNGLTCAAGAAVLPSINFGKSGNKSPQTKEYKIVTRKLGNSGLELPVISLGVMNADNPNLVKAALNAGIKHLDTAYVYQNGRNEEMIGEVIKNYSRDSFVLSTKLRGEPFDRKTGMFTKEAKAGPFIEKFETSLKRLQVDYIDIVYQHSLVTREATFYEEFLNALTKLKKDGKIGYIGASTHRNEPEVINAAVDCGVYDVVLTSYNFRQPHLKEVEAAIERASKAGLGVVAMKTQAGVYWDRERTQQINMKAALKWALQNENVHTAIPGMTTFDQLELDMAVMEDLKLTAEEINDLKLGEQVGMNGLFCPQCGKCTPQCKFNLDIPTYMRSYMYLFGYKDIKLAHDTYVNESFSKVVCEDCDECTVNCTVGFDVKEKVLKVAKLGDVSTDLLV
ncbi:aldo/keto reductase [Bacteroidota bacterium]